MRFRTGLVCLFLAVSSPALAQQPKAPPAKPAAPAQPVDLITKGKQLFEDQQYEESIATLSAALVRPGNTNEQKIEINRLLALNYITIGKKEEADSAVRALLVVNPDYQLPATESPRFRDFFAQARARWEAEGRPGLVKEEPTARPVVLKHGPPSQVDPGQAIELRGRLEDPDGRARSVKLYYREGVKGEFLEAPADLSNGSVRASIPGSAVKPPLVDYYFEVTAEDGSVVASRGDAQGPLRIAVREPSKGWVLPVAIGGGVLGAAAIVGALALAGVFSSSSERNTANVSITISDSAR